MIKSIFHRLFSKTHFSMALFLHFGENGESAYFVRFAHPPQTNQSAGTQIIITVQVFLLWKAFRRTSPSVGSDQCLPPN